MREFKRFQVSLTVVSAILAGCATADLSASEKERVVRLVNQNCIIVKRNQGVRVDERQITADSMFFQAKEPLDGDWTRYVIGSGRIAGSFFIHNKQDQIYCGVTSWPGVERANARLGGAPDPAATRTVRRTLTYTIAGEAEAKTGAVEWPEPFGRLVPFEVELGPPHGLCKGAATQRDWSMSCADGLSASGDQIRFADGKGGATGSGRDSLGRSVTWRISDE